MFAHGCTCRDFSFCAAALTFLFGLACPLSERMILAAARGRGQHASFVLFSPRDFTKKAGGNDSCKMKVGVLRRDTCNVHMRTEARGSNFDRNMPAEATIHGDSLRKGRQQNVFASVLAPEAVCRTVGRADSGIAGFHRA